MRFKYVRTPLVFHLLRPTAELLPCVVCVCVNIGFDIIEKQLSNLGFLYLNNASVGLKH
jgi:hypothetical protein